MSHGRKKGSRRNLMSHKGQRQQGRQVVANSSKCGCRAETSGAVRVETIRDGKRVDGGKNDKGTRKGKTNCEEEKQIAGSGDVPIRLYVSSALPAVAVLAQAVAATAR